MSDLQVTEQLARFVSELKLENVPEEVKKAAVFCILDTLGAALGAANDPDITGIVNETLAWEAVPSHGASVWGQGKKASIFTASMLNGCMSHALELDDNHSHSKSHPGGVVTAAAWAVAEAVGASGKELIEAVIAGYDVMGRIGSSIDIVSLRKHGFHNTGIFGTFGAAAAAGKLMGLSEKQLVYAFGIAGTEAAGLWGFLSDGASCKKFNSGKAACNGILAAVMAKGGMTGPVRVLDAEDGGLYPAMTDTFYMDKITENLGSDYVVMQMDKKLYPSCRTSHPSIDAALDLRSRYHISAEGIDRVLVESYEVAVFQCGFEKYPENSVEARFSIPYLAAAAFVNGSVSLDSFDISVIENDDIRRLAGKIKVAEDKWYTEQYYKHHWGCRMTVFMKDGQQYSIDVDGAAGSYFLPLSEEKVIAKFNSLVAPVLGKERSSALVRDITCLDSAGSLPILM